MERRQAANPFLRAALSYRRRGWSVIPVGRDKKCLLRSWKKYQQKLPTEDQIRKWWEEWPEANVAIILGPVSGNLVCRDFDDLRAWSEFELCYPDLAGNLPVVKSSERGRHVYFTGETKTLPFDDGELRSSKSYVVAPPSIHPSGTTYTWLQPLNGQVPDVAPAVFARSFLPDTERTEITEDNRWITEDNSGHEQDSTCPVPVTLDQAVRLALPEKPGKRHEKTFRFCRALKAIPQYAEADANDLWDEFCQWWEKAKPLTSGEHSRTDAWHDFCEGWSKVRFVLGDNPMSGVVERARNRPALQKLARHEDDKLSLIANICAELQILSGADPFFLAVRTAAGLVGIDKMAAQRRLRILKRGKIIEVVEPGTTNRAARLRYLCG